MLFVLVVTPYEPSAAEKPRVELLGKQTEYIIEAVQGLDPTKDLIEKLKPLSENQKHGARSTSSSTVSDKTSTHTRYVRTGTDKNGDPIGYKLENRIESDLKRSGIETRSGDVFWTDGRSAQWHKIGKDWFSIIFDNGTLTKLRQEDLGGALRKTKYLQKKQGPKLQGLQWETQTRYEDSSSERYTFNNEQGKEREELLRKSSDGTWVKRAKSVAEGGGLKVIKSDSTGWSHERLVSPEVVDRWQKRYARGVQNWQGKQFIKTYGNGSWQWRAVTEDFGLSKGLVRAHGLDGYLQEIQSGLISPWGTYYGRVTQSLKNRRRRPTNSNPIDQQIFPLDMGEQNKDIPEPKKVHQRDLRRLEGVIQAVLKIVEPQFHKQGLKPPMNYYVDPKLPTASTNLRARTVEIGGAVVHESESLQAGLLAHELKHVLDGDHLLNHLWDLDGLWQGLGRLLPAMISQLRLANHIRIFERRADTNEAKVLAIGNSQGKPWSIENAITFTHKVYKRWTPLATHDSAKNRERLLSRTFKRVRNQLSRKKIKGRN